MDKHAMDGHASSTNQPATQLGCSPTEKKHPPDPSHPGHYPMTGAVSPLSSQLQDLQLESDRSQRNPRCPPLSRPPDASCRRQKVLYILFPLNQGMSTPSLQLSSHHASSEQHSLSRSMHPSMNCIGSGWTPLKSRPKG
jgi:hypothetical protein